jgi:glycosyltransferase involved in cell wall biosynthesis
MNEDVFVIIPAYNEGKVIKKVLDEVQKSFSKIVIVDDGSSDNTAEEVLKTKAILVKHPINLGQGAALQTGIEYALMDPKAEYFVTFDSDGQHRTIDAMNMLEAIRKSNSDIILGSRFKQTGQKIPPLKRLTLKLAIIFTNMTSRVKLTDTHNGLRVFNRKFAEKLHIHEAGYAHGSEIISAISDGNFNYEEFPVTIDYTEHSLAKGQSVLNAVNIVFDLMIGKTRK